MSRHLFWFLSAFIVLSGARAEVIISEFMASNARTLNDEDGDSSDWIEIFNSSANRVSLEGWSLTDDRRALTKWRFPNVSLDGQEYLVVFASGKNKTNSAGRLHTNFQLSADGEYLALVGHAMNVASEFGNRYPSQFTDISYGRNERPLNTMGYFLLPTPGRTNAALKPDFAPDVHFSTTSGAFTAPFELRLSTTSGNAVIRYTLDGSLPTNSSPAYRTSLRISDSVQVRARAFEEGLRYGFPRTEAFVLLSNNVVNFTSDLPVIIIHSLGQATINVTNPEPASILVFEPINGVTSLTNAAALATRASIKVRKALFPKWSFNIEFQDEFGQDKSRDFVGLPSESDWVLVAPPLEDAILIHDPFIYQLSRDLGHYSPRTRFAEVYFNKGSGPIGATNYHGIYVVEEKIKIGKNRVDIDKLRASDLSEPELSGGYLLKIDPPDRGDQGFTAGGQTRLAYVDPKEHEITSPERAPQLQYISNYLQEMATALNRSTSPSPTLGYAAYIDVDSWIDYHILEVLSGNVDMLSKSTYFFKPRNGKLTFGPHWDMDLALGGFAGRASSFWWASSGPSGRAFTTGWWGWLFSDPDFWQRWIDRYQELRSTHLSLTNMARLIDDLTGEVRRAQPREQQRWFPRLRGLTYEQEIAFMKEWLSNKVDFIDHQFVPLPILRAEENSVTAALGRATDDTIYFTLDGSDPRQPQGGVSATARKYVGPVTSQNATRLIARAHNVNQRQTGGPPISSPWSGPATIEVRPVLRPRLEIKIAAVGGPVISFTPVPGRLYLIQFCEDLGIDLWQTLSTVVGTPEATPIVITNSVASQTRFFRVTSP